MSATGGIDVQVLELSDHRRLESHHRGRHCEPGGNAVELTDTNLGLGSCEENLQLFAQTVTVGREPLFHIETCGQTRQVVKVVNGRVTYNGCVHVERTKAPAKR